MAKFRQSLQARFSVFRCFAETVKIGMVKFKRQSEPQTNTQDFARCLRAIGQDLAKLYPEGLEIELKGQDFIARGRSMAPEPHRDSDAEKNSLRNAWNKLVQQGSKEAPARAPVSRVPFERIYTPDDINRLDDAGAAKRTETKNTPDIYSLAERLRTIGRMVDAQGGQLIKLLNDLTRVTFEYRDPQGEVHLIELSTRDLYTRQKEYYSGRGTFKPKDPWGGFEP